MSKRSVVTTHLIYCANVATKYRINIIAKFCKLLSQNLNNLWTRNRSQEGSHKRLIGCWLYCWFLVLEKLWTQHGTKIGRREILGLRTCQSLCNKHTIDGGYYMGNCPVYVSCSYPPCFSTFQDMGAYTYSLTRCVGPYRVHDLIMESTHTHMHACTRKKVNAVFITRIMAHLWRFLLAFDHIVHVPSISCKDSWWFPPGIILLREE